MQIVTAIICIYVYCLGLAGNDLPLNCIHQDRRKVVGASIKVFGIICPPSLTLRLQINYYAWKMWVPRSQCFSPQMNNRHPLQLKKSKSFTTKMSQMGWIGNASCITDISKTVPRILIFFSTAMGAILTFHSEYAKKIIIKAQWHQLFVPVFMKRT